MCFLNINELSDDEIEKKIILINNKLNAAYGTSIAQNYIDTLENTLEQLYSLQDERSFLKNNESSKKPPGTVIETDPELSEFYNNSVKTSEENEAQENKQKREFVGPKIIKTYKK